MSPGWWFSGCLCNVEALGDTFTELDGSLIWIQIWFLPLGYSLCQLGVYLMKRSFEIYFSELNGCLIWLKIWFSLLGWGLCQLDLKDHCLIRVEFVGPFCPAWGFWVKGNTLLSRSFCFVRLLGSCTICFVWSICHLVLIFSLMEIFFWEVIWNFCWGEWKIKPSSCDVMWHLLLIVTPRGTLDWGIWCVSIEQY